MENIELNFSHLIASFNEYKQNPESNLLKDRMKKHLINAYDALDYNNNDLDEPKFEKQSVTMKLHESPLLDASAGENVVTQNKLEEVSEIEEELDIPLKEVKEVSFEANTFIEEKKVHDFDLFSEFLGEENDEEIVELPIEQHGFVENEIASEDGVLENREVYMEAPSDELEEVSYVEKVRLPHADVMEEYKNRSIESLATTIPIGKKFEFIEDLFIGNSDEYSNAIKQIDSMSDFEKAEQFLMQNYFDKFGWMEKEKVLNNLFDFVTRRFVA